MSKDYVFFITTYPARVNNLPAVIRTLKGQTIKPRDIVLTVAASQYDEMRPVLETLEGVTVEIVKRDTKVWKKFLPVMEKYCGKDGLFICVDDDKLYLPGMAEDLLKVYAKYGSPVSGNHYWHNGLKCHCGNASLVWARMFEGWRKYEHLFGTPEMLSDDMFVTMLAANNHYAYKNTDINYEKANTKYNEGTPYTQHGVVQRTYLYAAKLFGWI